MMKAMKYWSIAPYCRRADSLLPVMIKSAETELTVDILLYFIKVYIQWRSCVGFGNPACSCLKMPSVASHWITSKHNFHCLFCHSFVHIKTHIYTLVVEGYKTFVLSWYQRFCRSGTVTEYSLRLKPGG